jgi:chemotaxis protein histidine kinase CheA
LLIIFNGLPDLQYGIKTTIKILLVMSEEFLRVARQEVSEDISNIGKLLEGCKTDSDVTKNSSEIEKHIHKIKGLAPMMGQEQIGNIATLLDKVFKAMLAGDVVPKIYQTITQSHQFMHDALNGNVSDYDSLVLQIQSAHKDLV